MGVLAALIGAFGWVVHPLAGLGLAFFASVIFSRRGRDWRPVAVAAALLVGLAVLGADWVVHPAAGMLLGFFGSQAFHRWREHWPALLAGLVSAAFFMALGASWLIFPLLIMGMIWLFTAVFTWPGEKGPAPLGSSPSVSALPEQGGGLPLGGFGSRAEKVAAKAARREARRQARHRLETPPPPVPAPAAPDLFTAYLRDERLPGEARAQLAALNLRTREALAHLETLGQQGSEAAYLARAVREEYAPTAVQAYLKLPPTLADTAPLQDGKTGRDLLREQLDILLDAVQDILGTTLRAGGQDLLTHQRFLEEKFRKARGDLEV
ncbi:hypothetical protein DEIPH_ctg079orf0087 [Deinococcus phoenicis]|uniref:Uncharacterized protein n=1 Tax=Deinococcus phoenicis TaxID=1476583 RepID=A0A016QL25_9DEIO|nr:hypothetical protein [Deinococcus phoenicis]EYB66691.1 hypothetical protein DEIPH_ctg079orf0087 [Deinococcus phoenicis]